VQRFTSQTNLWWKGALSANKSKTSTQLKIHTVTISLLEPECSLSRKAGKTTKQPHIQEDIFSLSKKEKQQSKRPSLEDPQKKKKVRGSVISNATLLQERIDESGDDEDDDYVPKQSSRSSLLKTQRTRKINKAE